MQLVQQLTNDQVQADVGACVSDLRTLGCSSIFTVDFCYGGSGSWAAAASGHELAGAVGFYGRPSRMIELVPSLEAPILALQGGADQGIPHEDNVEFEQALSEAGKDYEHWAVPAGAKPVSLGVVAKPGKRAIESGPHVNWADPGIDERIG